MGPRSVEDVAVGSHAAAETVDFLTAIDDLTEANRRSRDPRLERRLVSARHLAFDHLKGASGPPTWPAVAPSSSTAEEGTIPVVSASDLTAEALSTAIHAHGCLHVRELFPHGDVDRLVLGIDRAISGYDSHAEGRTDPEAQLWFEPFVPRPPYTVGVKRKWVRDAGGVWTADSPRVLFELIEAMRSVGLDRVIERYLGERPVMSVNKATLRRVPLDTSSDWHQDGAFLGEGTHALNVWLSLSHCGRDAPGLDIVPRRFDRVVETGTEGAVFPWAVGPGVVDRVRERAPIARPVFAPGDVLLFDDLMLHRTAVDDSMTHERYAIETWFFGASVYPGHQIPLVF